MQNPIDLESTVGEGEVGVDSIHEEVSDRAGRPLLFGLQWGSR